MAGEWDHDTEPGGRQVWTFLDFDNDAAEHLYAEVRTTSTGFVWSDGETGTGFGWSVGEAGPGGRCLHCGVEQHLHAAQERALAAHRLALADETASFGNGLIPRTP